MKLAALVPTLGVLALVSSAANAQEVAKGLFLDGWADNIFSYTTQPKRSVDPASTGSPLADKSTDLADFSANAKIKVSWKPNDKITGFVGVKFNNKSTDAAYLQESYALVDLGNDLSWQMGKYIAHVGYVSAEPTGLYRINGSTIGALLYTNDVIGTNIAWAPKDVPFSGSFHVVNGFFNGKDTFNDTSVPGVNTPATADAASTANDTKRSDLGIGLDLIYNLPDSRGFINLEFAWDPSSSAPNAQRKLPSDPVPAGLTGKKNSDIFQVGINGEVKPVDKLKLGAEFIWRNSKNAAVDESGNADNKQDVEFLAMANYVLPTTTPASATLMYQELNQDFGSKTAHTPVVHEFSAAVLTNPFGSDKLGVNGEIAYAKVDGTPEGNATADQVVISFEALVVIP